MPQWSDYTNGQRIKILRGREITQPQLAERCGLSVVTIQKAEQDKVLSLTTLLRIAGALGVDTSVILGQQAPRRAMSMDDRAMLRELSRAVHDSWVGLLPRTVAAPSADELRAAVDACWARYWEGHYAEAGAIVAPLLEAATAHRHEQPHDRQATAWGLISDAHRLAAYVANLMGARDLAYAAIGHAQEAAESAADNMRHALVTSGRAWVYLRDSRLKAALDLAEKSAVDIEPRFSRATPGELVAYGSHVNFAAVVAARLEKKERAKEFLSQSHAAGARLGEEIAAHGTRWGPVSATTQAVGVNVGLGRIGKALALADDIKDVSALSPAAQNRYSMDLALAQAHARQWDASLDTLEETLTKAPEWSRHQVLPGVIVEKVGRASTARLRRVSKLLGVSNPVTGGFDTATEKSAL
ncbi:helix-turn-helix domain-containing protein [Streptomyces radicis]|uniref:XRE family transcriptional regulator n=1 Tax=Streptomyces radicis TaxID=1750517 RepID=A0A3A9WG44_9ACTN|nr:helix-turn-helix transcriptional regulator [Streptomyces radicis]RKN11592.1 XRE family transcriptional regulator [Streptomyces radicis]RKN26389.1 XRE family transcriptional regulator [Streptomyces radicis]